MQQFFAYRRKLFRHFANAPNTNGGNKYYKNISFKTYVVHAQSSLHYENAIQNLLCITKVTTQLNTKHSCQLNMHKQVLVLLALFCVFVSAEKKIQECTRREVELQVSREACYKARTLELAARKDRNEKENIYNTAVTRFDFAYGRWQVALREITSAKVLHHTDVAVLTSIRTAEHKLCNRLIRNVEANTPCAKLLDRARKNNRLFQCRQAKKTLQIAIEKEVHSRTHYESKNKAMLNLKAIQIGLRRERDIAFERLKVSRALWNVRNSAQTSSCSRYHSLNINFHGKKKERVERRCKNVTECASFTYRCVNKRNVKVCSHGRHETRCVAHNGRVCVKFHHNFVCTAYRNINSCFSYKPVCISHKKKQICARTFTRPRVSGPATCPAGHSLAFRKQGKFLARFCRRTKIDRRREAICQSTYDPTIYSFARKYYQLSSEGDYEMYASHDGSVEVHTRQELFPNSPATANSQLAVLLNGVDLISYDCKSKVFRVNGKYTKLTNQQFKNGGSLRLIQPTYFELFAPNGDKIATRIAGNSQICWLNIYVYSKNTQGGGLCYAEHKDSEKFRVTGLFRHFELPHDSKNAIASAQRSVLQQSTPALRQAAHVACNMKLPAYLKKRCEKDWLLAPPNSRKLVIAGYERLVNDEFRGHISQRNFF